jgi:hypothetical protein
VAHDLQFHLSLCESCRAKHGLGIGCSSSVDRLGRVTVEKQGSSLGIQSKSGLCGLFVHQIVPPRFTHVPVRCELHSAAFDEGTRPRL